MRKLLFMLKGIFYTGLSLVWLILIICIIVIVMFIHKTWLPMMKGPIEGPMYGTHGPY